MTNQARIAPGHNYEVVQVSQNGMAVLGDVYGNFNIFVQQKVRQSRQPPRTRRICYSKPQNKPLTEAQTRKLEHRRMIERLQKDFEALQISGNDNSEQSLRFVVCEFGVRTYGMDVPIHVSGSSRELLSNIQQPFARLSRGDTTVATQIADPGHFDITRQFMHCLDACIACSRMYDIADQERLNFPDRFRNLGSEVADLVAYRHCAGIEQRIRQLGQLMPQLFSAICDEIVFGVLKLLSVVAWDDNRQHSLGQHLLPLIRIAQQCSARMLGLHHPLHQLITLYITAVEQRASASFPVEYALEKYDEFGNEDGQGISQKNPYRRLSTYLWAASTTGLSEDQARSLSLSESSLTFASLNDSLPTYALQTAKYTLAMTYTDLNLHKAAEELYTDVRGTYCEEETLINERLRAEATHGLAHIAFFKEGNAAKALYLYRDALEWMVKVEELGEVAIKSQRYLDDVCLVLITQGMNHEIEVLRRRYPKGFVALEKEWYVKKDYNDTYARLIESSRLYHASSTTTSQSIEGTG